MTTAKIQKRRFKEGPLASTFMVDNKKLKTCIRCRQHKTKCDAWLTRPVPCSHCNKKNLKCTLDVINNKQKKSTDVIEKLTDEVHGLREAVDALISNRNRVIRAFAPKRETTNTPSPASVAAQRSPSLSEIQGCINLAESNPSYLAFENDEIEKKEFTINSNLNTDFVSISKEEAIAHLRNYENNFNKFLPIFPDDFFITIDVPKFVNENELLFWCIILTSHLNQNLPHQYFRLCEHIKSLVVEKCWLQTPRSVYTLSSLLILTSWPLPTSPSGNFSDNLSIKFISLMRSLSLQFGLHKLEFIEEFSHKTKMNISNEVNLNNIIRERIYKFIGINSNYWLINLGLSNNNFNGFQKDYILSNSSIGNKVGATAEDNHINSLLKISLVQSKMNENLNELVKNDDPTSKLIYLNMFEIILNDISLILNSNRMIQLSIELSKLQLYVYSFSDLNVDVHEYKLYIKRALASCYVTLNLFEEEFPHITNIYQLPIHFKSLIELCCLIMLRVYKSPLLDSEKDYVLLKKNFNRAYEILSRNVIKTPWYNLNSRFIHILKKVNELDNVDIIARNSDSFFLISKMKDHLVSSLRYELIWYIYGSIKMVKCDLEMIDWKIYGLDDSRGQHKEVIDYLKRNHSIFM
ncbi:uncharacterized protein PRCAT00005982001 [Priceomyces carsonii]|uniref:uncharacterized protein n=1 Tax=Priceomyces carsonii TaxID=28549 RepID=UPI002EDB43D8|nr:unnamed protein product [Priceomyces carsonii]